MSARSTGSERVRSADRAEFVAAAERIQQAVALLIPAVRRQRLHAHVGARAGVALNPSAYRVLARIGRVGPVRVSDVAANVGIEVSSLSRLLIPLTDAGLVARSSDPNDGRVSILSLTEAGRRSFDALHLAWVEVIEEFLEGWNDGEIETFSDEILRFAEALALFEPPAR